MSEESSLARVRRLAQFWNWLPAFRAVAESEHLPTAAKELSVSAPGLSRTVRQLEEAVERQLFERGSRRILLNDTGRVLLAHVRDAMRRIDDGLQALHDQTFRGPVRIAASNSAAFVYLLPAVELLAQAHSELEPELIAIDEEQACVGLRKGALDLALIEQADVPADLDVEALATFNYSVYCGSEHPLREAAKVTMEELLQHPFVAPPAGIDDGWPLNLRRTVRLRVTALNLATRACAHGRLLALLPDGYVRAADSQLHRLPLDPLGQQNVFVAHRKRITEQDRVGATLDALRQAAADIVDCFPSATVGLDRRST